MPRRYRDTKEARRRQRYERSRMRARQKEYLRELRYDKRREFWLMLGSFFSNPKKALFSPTEEERKAKARKKRRRHEQMLRLADFLRNPFRAIFKPGPLAEERKRMKNLQRIRRYEERRLARSETQMAWREIRRYKDLRRSIIREFLQSSAWYLLAALFIYVTYQVVTISVANTYDIPVIWQYNRLIFPLYTWSPLYTRQALVVIFASAPVVSLLIGLLALRLFFVNKGSRSRLNTFLLWTFVHGINMFFGAYLAGILTRTEFVYASEWLFLSNPGDIEEIIFGVLSITTLIITGRQMVFPFLLASGSITLVKPRYRLFFVIFTIILPWLIGVVLFFVITLPHYYIPLILKTLTPGLIVLPTLVLYNSVEYESLHESGLIRRRSFRWGVIILVIAMLFFYRLILNWGITFE